jgi:hypothetical protein
MRKIGSHPRDFSDQSLIHNAIKGLCINGLRQLHGQAGWSGNTFPAKTRRRFGKEGVCLPSQDADTRTKTAYACCSTVIRILRQC